MHYIIPSQLGVRRASEAYDSYFQFALLFLDLEMASWE